MKKKTVWFILSCLMVVSLVLASCAPAVVEEKKAAEKVAEEKVAPEKVAPEKAAPVYTPPGPYSPATAPEMPQYGGTLRFCYKTEPLGFDVVRFQRIQCWTGTFTNGSLITSDWARGPAGTGEFPMNIYQNHFNIAYPAGELATSWESPDPNTIIYHIREGVYWQDKPPYNGRMLTAKDVVRSITAHFTTGSFMLTGYPGWFQSVEVDPDDEWSVIVHGVDSVTVPTLVMRNWLGEYMFTDVPVEAGELYGGLGDWRHAVGTGPFLLEDFVPETSMSFVRNPNWWMKDPCGPGEGNQLPYLDVVKGIMITDKSTALAALRTAQIDYINNKAYAHDIVWEDAKSLQRTTPELMWGESASGKPVMIGLRVDIPELPTYNKDVRRALNMAVDNQAITETYFGGQAYTVSGPLIAQDTATWIPWEEFPESIRELYEYHPDKARELLAKAGYPNGFKIDVLVRNDPDTVDQVSIIKEYWADIGVTLNMDIRETGVATSLIMGFKYNTGLMEYRPDPSKALRVAYCIPGMGYNVSRCNDPIGNELRAAVFKWRETVTADMLTEAGRKASLYYMDQAYYLTLPSPFVYTFWWPWVKNYNGATYIDDANYHGTTRYIWIDQDLKKSMGY